MSKKRILLVALMLAGFVTATAAVTIAFNTDSAYAGTKDTRNDD